MREFVEYLVKKMVEHPDAVTVNMIEHDRGTLYEVHVATSDMGRVIGREGRVANAIRILAKSLAKKQGKRVQVEIVQPVDADESAGSTPLPEAPAAPPSAASDVDRNDAGSKA